MPPWKRRPADDDDQGFSLMEVLVTTGIMSVVTIVAVTALLQIYSGTRQIEQNSVAGDQLDISYVRLDRELHYATYVYGPTPGATNSRSYLEFAVPPRQKLLTDTVDPPVRCRQLMFDPVKKTLTMATWDLPGTTPGTPATLATDVVLDAGATTPFAVVKPGDTPFVTASAGTVGVGPQFNANYLMVRIRFQAKVGDAVQRFDNSFTSQNITDENDGDTSADPVPDPDRNCSNVGRP
ncbi:MULTISPECIES: type II secretion system protein J [unclassified Actinoplanes]|uniref:PulJ/GspJ family protein n=1 Tax=unclassified Actinoplanes TaxID=2626549 RepID=UPI0002EEDC80|nr:MULTISPECIES: prepilin-type N-terminal cleavage/methylation domain-containing protein [unclassified Actinoplanes]